MCITCRCTQVILGTLADGYVRAGRMQEAEQLVDRLSPLVTPNRIVFNTLLRGYANRGPDGVTQVLGLLGRMRRANIQPDADTYTTLMHAAISVPDHTSATQLYQQMLQQGVQPDTVACTALMRMFVDNGQTDEVLEVRPDCNVAGCCPQ